MIPELLFHLLYTPTYQHIDDSFKTPTQPTITELNTANGLPITALGITALHLRIADFKFTHNFVIHDRLPGMEMIFGIDIQNKFSISYAWDKDKNCYIQKRGKFLTYTRTCEQKPTIGVVKLTLKILPRHNGVVPIKITGLKLKLKLYFFLTAPILTIGCGGA